MNNIRMNIVVFDTETTGLPKSVEPASKSPNNWPHLVSISWVVLENTLPHAILKQRSYIIKPENWTIPEDSIKIHKITNEMLLAAAQAIANCVDEEQINSSYIIPSVFDKRVANSIISI